MFGSIAYIEDLEARAATILTCLTEKKRIHLSIEAIIRHTREAVATGNAADDCSQQ